jgi:hypothetical protein
VDGIYVKRCHWDAGSARLFNHRPIRSCGFWRKIGEHFSYRLSETLAHVIIISLKTAAATTALGTLFLRKTRHFDEFRSQWRIIFIIIGALATLVASYLARARGSNEPELSITRIKDLEQFIRDCRSFQLDHGHSSGHELDPELIRFRRRFEELLGNANG